MNRKEAIKIWLDGAEDAMVTCDKLFESKRYHHALFFLHLAVEKALKAYYTTKKGKTAPYSHGLAYIAEKSGLKLDRKTQEELEVLTDFNVSARYEDYKLSFYKKATKEFSEKWMKIGKKLYKEFLSQI